MKSSIPSDENLLKAFSFENTQTKLGYLDVQERRIRFVKLSIPDEIIRPMLVMVHGAPGGILGFEKYAQDSELRSRYDMLIYERPGYGIDDTLPEESVKLQANILVEIVDSQLDNDQNVVFLSHSYGGPIAVLASTAIRIFCVRHVMVAPVLDGLSEPVFWFSSIPSKWLIRDLIGQEWYTSSVEKLTHKKALNEVKHLLRNVNCLTVHFHGLEDWIAPPDNISFAQNHFPSHMLDSNVLQSKSHFILWSQDTFELIKRSLLSL